MELNTWSEKTADEAIRNNHVAATEKTKQEERGIKPNNDILRGACPLAFIKLTICVAMKRRFAGTLVRDNR